ncbi:hypothetical protein [Croceicoccus naphthovorans]|uniref:Uncharacterized protein n=1 Tax=Croceicoccus naphthovorans TaxID=1348774 RepID=A0A0G3XE19_9SPHN|nr:hypothetical protein [Croceicoccus naphthovorans]AKM09790.1 hypothetical protein AB433_07005 [Croceicoccus naphthovorans]MBB3990660.1 hypothetical protein [Croceicoccus naphthovorans]
MTESEVIEAKRLRRAARDVFDTQKDLVKADLDAASLGKRVATRLVEDGKYMAEEAADAASNHKVIATAGGLALTGWLLRKPLMAFAASVFGSGGDTPDEEAEHEEAEPEPQDTAEDAQAD